MFGWLSRIWYAVAPEVWELVDGNGDVRVRFGSRRAAEEFLGLLGEVAESSDFDGLILRRW